MLGLEGVHENLYSIFIPITRATIAFLVFTILYM